MLVAVHGMPGMLDAQFIQLVDKTAYPIIQEVLLAAADIARRKLAAFLHPGFHLFKGINAGTELPVHRDARGHRAECTVLLRVFQRMDQRAIAAHGKACDVSILRAIGNREIRLHEFRQLLVQEVIVVIAIGQIVVCLVLRIQRHKRDALLLRQALHARIAHPAVSVVSMTMEQIEHGEFRRKHVGPFLIGITVAGRKARNGHFNAHAVAQRIGIKIHRKPCHGIPPYFSAMR